jgi:hypothetical protein
MLHGTLVAISADTVTWRYPQAARAIEFKTRGLAEITIGAHTPSTALAPSGVVARLTNGDELQGKIISLDGQKLELDTWFAGRLSIPRKLVKSFAPIHARGSAIYEGPNGMKGWKSSGTEWTYRDGALICRGSATLGRNFELPNLASIELQVAWRGSLQFGIGLQVVSLDEPENNGYLFAISEGTAALQKVVNGNAEDLGSIEVRSLNESDRARVEIRVNREQRTFYLLIDGVLARQWTDPGKFLAKGKGLVLISEGPAALKVGKIKIAEWDGRMEALAGGTAAEREDVVRLTNTDRISGKLDAIADGRAALLTPHGTLGIPLEKIDEIQLALLAGGTRDRRLGEVRAFVRGGGFMTVRLDQWKADLAVATSASFGRATFSAGALQRIQFNTERAVRPGGGDPGDSEGDAEAAEFPR